MIRRFDEHTPPHPEFWEHCRAMEQAYGLPLPMVPSPPAAPVPLDVAAILSAMFAAIPLERWLSITDKAVEQALAGDRHARNWLTQLFLTPRKTR